MLFAAVHESAFGPKRTSLVALHMSAFGGKADIFVILSAISLRQCRSMRRWIAEPFLRSGARVAGLSLITVGESFFNVSKAGTWIDCQQSFRSVDK